MAPPVLVGNLAKCHLPRGAQRAARRGKTSQSSSAWLNRQSKDPYVRRARDAGSPSRAIFKLEQIDRLAAKHVSKKSTARGSAKEERSNANETRRGGWKKRRSLFEIGQKVIDLGASPGGWSLYAAEKIGKSGTLVSVDLLQLDSGALSTLERNDSFRFIQGDFNATHTKDKVADALREYTLNQAQKSGEDAIADQIIQSCASCVISDMAANFTGDKLTDSLRTLSLCEDALMFAIGSSCFDYEAKAGNSHLSSDILLSPWEDIGVLNIGGTFLCKFFSCGQENERDLMLAAKHHFERIDVLKPPASRKESGEQYLLATGYKGNGYFRALLKHQRS